MHRSRLCHTTPPQTVLPARTLFLKLSISATSSLLTHVMPATANAWTGLAAPPGGDCGGGGGGGGVRRPGRRRSPHRALLRESRRGRSRGGRDHCRRLGRAGGWLFGNGVWHILAVLK